MPGPSPRPAGRRAGRAGALALPAALLGALACSGPSGQMRQAVNGMIAAGDYAAAEKRIASAKETAYGRKNAALYHLDLGAVRQDAGRYAESDESLDFAERRLEELYTRSASREAAAFVVNDNSREYSGQRHERVLLNAYRALNFLLRGDREGAMVEVRKLVRLLQELSDAATAGAAPAPDEGFAQTLAAFLYEDEGLSDDARICREKAAASFEAARRAHGRAPPSLEPAGAPASPSAGELLFLHANGPAPRLVSRSFSAAWGEAALSLESSKDDEAEAAQARNAIRAGLSGAGVAIALPAHVQDPYRIAASRIEAAGYAAGTALLEDVTELARRALEERLPAVRARALARAAVKFALAHAASEGAAKKYGRNSWQHLAAQAASAAAAAATEVADTRAWATLPAQIRAARLRLPAGTHDVTVVYLTAAGEVVATRTFKGVKILAGRRSYLRDRTAL